METIEIDSSPEIVELFQATFLDEVSAIFDDATMGGLFTQAVMETLDNAAEHGGHYDLEKRILIKYLLQANFALIYIEDEGSGFTPVFPNLKQAREHMGLGFIKAYSDVLLFNQKANGVTLIKGKDMKKKFHEFGTITQIDENYFVLTDLNVGIGGTQSGRVQQVIEEALEMASDGKKHFFIDLKSIKLFSSRLFSLLYSEADQGHRFTFFNGNPIITKVFQTAGIEDNSGDQMRLTSLENAIEQLAEMIENPMESKAAFQN